MRAFHYSLSVTYFKADPATPNDWFTITTRYIQQKNQFKVRA